MRRYLQFFDKRPQRLLGLGDDGLALLGGKGRGAFEFVLLNGKIGNVLDVVADNVEIDGAAHGYHLFFFGLRLAAVFIHAVARHAMVIGLLALECFHGLGL